MRFLHLEETDSTNSYVKAHATELESMTMVYTDRQRAGRGQRGNSWESEPGKNFTFSVLWRFKDFPANRQFAISEATALAICDALRMCEIYATVKWPNDIYVDDRKICGILIEHAVGGSDLMHSIIGAGINVNQSVFTSDAPNPVSVANLTGKEHNLEMFRGMVAQMLSKRLYMLEDIEKQEEQHQEFKERLWRKDGMHPYIDAASGEKFLAEIADVEPRGMLVLKTENGNLRRYAFKEVSAVLGS